LRKKALTLIIIIILIFPSTINSGTINLHSEENKIKVVSTLELYASIAEYIGNGFIDTDYILPEGADPHDYSLTPGDIEKIESADLLMLANSDFFTLEKNMLSHYSGTILDFDDYSRYNLTIISLAGLGKNYHGYWIYPDNALAIAKAVHDKLVLLDPAHRDIYDSNLERFIDAIYRLKSLLYRVALDSNIYGVGTVIAVPGAAYLAVAFGLKIEASLLKGPGSFVNSSELNQIYQKAHDGLIKLILCPESLRNGKPGEISRQLSRDTGLPVIYVRVFSMYGLKDYFALMTYNAGALSNAEKVSSKASKEDFFIWYLISIGILFSIVIVESIMIFLYKRRAEEVWVE